MLCVDSLPPPLICIKTAVAIGIHPANVTKIADDRAEQLKRNPDAVIRKWTSVCERTCEKRGISFAFTRCPNQDKMFPMTWTHVSSCWTSTIPTAKTQTARPGDG